MERKDEGFISFADALLRRAEKLAPLVDVAERHERVGPHALERVKAGNAVLF
jgi:hypothetical protein